jgi:hypothetical protein
MKNINRRTFLQGSLTAAALSVLPPVARVNAAPAQNYTVVWDLAKAYHEATPTREQICVNGLWRWQPAAAATDAAPTDGWGYLRVPDCWPGGPGGREQRWGNPQVFFPDSSWEKQDLGAVASAWYQREIIIPQTWAGRRITLHAEYLNSYAVVFVDGAKAGEMRFPWGEVDLTSACRPGQKHVLSVRVDALPLSALTMASNDSNAPRQVAARVERRGLCGDLYLTSTPGGSRIADVRVATSVRNWQITFDTALAALESGANYTLRAEVSEGDKVVKEFSSVPFQSDEVVDGRIRIIENWRPEKLWDTHTPQNQYHVSVSLLNTGGKVLDTALPVRFGFREFWIEGRDFYLNGSRIYLAAIPLDNAQDSATRASYEATRATLQRYKSFGINFVYTHNYSCLPGVHRSFEEILRAADDEGMLLSFSQPHFGQYNWVMADADTKNGYAGHAAFYVHVAGSHPSVVCYSTSHNSTGTADDMNPDTIDGIIDTRDEGSARNTGRAMRAEAIIRRLDPSRFVYHHSSGNLSTMHTINFYGNWIPIQEMSDWFEHWATVGMKPVFTCEYSVPFMWDYSMYRGWYKGHREFGNAIAPWEFCLAEWNAQFLGPRSYQITEPEKENLRWEAEQFRKGLAWGRNSYPHTLNAQVFDEEFRVIAMYLTDNFRAFRTWGMAASSPWEYGSYWKRPARERGSFDLPLEIDWEHLQRPGPRAAYLHEDQAREQLAFHPADYQPTLAGEALYRNYLPLLAYIAGKPEAFTTKDHNFLPGERVEKQLVIINNSRAPVTADCEWSLDLPSALTGRASVTVPTGQQDRIPLNFELPSALAAGRYTMHGTVKFSNGDTQTDTFSIDVMPRPAAVSQPSGKIALFDPKGDTAKLLEGMGIQTERVEASADLSGYETLIIGKGALTLHDAAPSAARVNDGLRVIVFEQTGEVLEKRFGFRVAEYGLRWVFASVPDHPTLAGLGEEHLRNWRGESTTLPPRLTYQRNNRVFNGSPTVEWAGITVTRVYRCGNRGNVASALIEKPACGDFLPILDGGYALQYSPLIEHRAGKGMVLFCQMDVSGRTEADPAAQRLAQNILQYVSTWKPAARRTVVYAGDPSGISYLSAAGIRPAMYLGGSLSQDQVLVVGPGGGRSLTPHGTEIAEWLKGGGRVLAIGLDENDASAGNIGMEKREHIATYFEPFGVDSPFAGVSPADVHNRAPRELLLVRTGATVVGDGVLALAESGSVVICQLVPWQLDYSGGQMNIKRTYRRVSCMVARLLANQGAAGRSLVIDRVATPVAENEKRWLEGLYLDVPEEWDDPYRYFRW